MKNEIPMDILLSVDPDVAHRAERLQFSVDLLKRGHPEREVRKRVEKKFGCSRVTAWREVSKAKDIS